MNYNTDLPEALKSVSIPKFKIMDKKLIIFNRPYLWDWIFPTAFITIFFVMIINGKISLTNNDYSDYVTLALTLLVLVIIVYLSLNRVCVDFEKKLISIKNYNPLVNLGRKLFQMPFIIGFKDVDKIFIDQNWFSGQLIRFYVILETDTPYKFRIAIFSKRQESIVFAEYLNHILK
jgi:phage-related holin